MAPSTRLRDLQGKLRSKRDLVKRIMEQSKKADGSYDLKLAEVFQHCETDKACKEMLDQINKECDDLNDQVTSQQAMEEQEAKNLKAIESSRIIENHMVHADRDNGYDNSYGNGNGYAPARQMKSLGERVKETWPEDRMMAKSYNREFRDIEIKALMATGAGFAPEVTRIPRIVEIATRPIQITDLMPVGTTDQSAIQYMVESTFTNNAAEVVEATGGSSPDYGSNWPEMAMAYTEVTTTVRKIAAWIPVTDEQLADASQVASLIDARMGFAARQRLDSEIINGSATPPAITGFLNTPNVQTTALGTLPRPDAVYAAIVACQVTGRSSPNAIIMHPTDWGNIRTLRTTSGEYIWGHPAETGIQRLWGLPVAVADVIAQGTALVGDFANFSQLWVRSGVSVESGYIGNQFIRGIQTIRVQMRAVLTVYRPSAFCMVTGL